MPSASAIAGQTLGHTKTSPLVTLKISLRGLLQFARPGDGARQQVGIDRLRDAADAARIVELGVAGARMKAA